MSAMMKKAKHFVLWYNTRNTVMNVKTATNVIRVLRTLRFGSAAPKDAERMRSATATQRARLTHQLMPKAS